MAKFNKVLFKQSDIYREDDELKINLKLTKIGYIYFFTRAFFEVICSKVKNEPKQT